VWSYAVKGGEKKGGKGGGLRFVGEKATSKETRKRVEHGKRDRQKRQERGASSSHQGPFCNTTKETL